MNVLLTIYLALVVLCYSRSKYRTAVVKHPNAPYPVAAIVSDWSPDILDTIQPIIGNFVVHSSDPEGCAEWSNNIKKSNDGKLQIGLVDRGTCTFLQKTKLAQLAGLDAIFVVSNDENIIPMDGDDKELEETRKEIGTENIIFSAMVPQSFKILVSQPGNLKIPIELTAYDNSRIFDASMIVMIFVSTILVAMGAYYSSDQERAKMLGLDSRNNGGLRQRAPIQEIDSKTAWSFVIVASIGLLTLYFFVSKIFIFVVIVFCIGATNGLSTIFAHAIDCISPKLQTIQYYWKFIDLQFTLSDLLGFIPAALVTITWFLTRKQNRFAWISQNIMCVGLLLVLQRTVRMPNLKIATILLGTAFFYDIFWVFISPLMFESSVMVSVATYHHGGNPVDTLPVVLKFPKINDIFHGPMILGLGDIALPGLLISYLLRFDYTNKVEIGINNIKQGYFVIGVIGYAIGMLLTDINLILMQKGQPALFTLVPCTLGVVIIISYQRGQFKKLWNGGKVIKSNEFLLKS